MIFKVFSIGISSGKPYLGSLSPSAQDTYNYGGSSILYVSLQCQLLMCLYSLHLVLHHKFYGIRDFAPYVLNAKCQVEKQTKHSRCTECLDHHQLAQTYPSTIICMPPPFPLFQPSKIAWLGSLGSLLRPAHIRDLHMSCNKKERYLMEIRVEPHSHTPCRAGTRNCL